MFKDIILGAIRPQRGWILVILCFALFYPSAVTQEQPKVLTKEEQRDVLRETQCLTEALWQEARGEGIEGLLAVLSVIHNRKNYKGFPNTYCGVVHQKHQFSYRNDTPIGMVYKDDSDRNQTHSPYKALNDKTKGVVPELAFDAVVGSFQPILGPYVLYYTRKEIKRSWMGNLKKDATIKSHQFYAVKTKE